MLTCLCLTSIASLCKMCVLCNSREACLQQAQLTLWDAHTVQSILAYISVSHPDHPGQLSSLQDRATGAIAPEGPSSSKLQGSSVQHPLRPPTSAKQAGPWIVAFRNTTGPWRMETLQPLLLPSMVLMWPPGQFVQGHSDRHTPAHQNSLHAAWSPGTANASGPLSTETGDSARTVAVGDAALLDWHSYFRVLLC